jgi:abhydrolase domain-containing protein 11
MLNFGRKLLVKPIKLLHISRCYQSQSVNLAYNVYDKFDSNPKTELIVLHGLFGSKSNWNSLSKAFNMKMSRKIFAVDAR